MRRTSTRFSFLLSRACREQEGFTLIELLVAMGILLIALLALARTATIAFTDVAQARQRQTGAQLANRLLEEVRGLPYDTVRNGLDDADLAGDANIVPCGTDYMYLACGGEEVVHNPGLSNASPLVPHQGSVGPPDFPSDYTWSVYVTEAEDVPEAGSLRVTVRVSWVGNQRAGLRDFVEAQTFIYAPEGCVDTATHPFAAPCQPYFYGYGTLGAGTVRTTGTVEGFTFDTADVDLLGQSADGQIEQIINVEGAVNLPQASTVVDGVQTATDPLSASSAGDDDPSTAAGEWSQDSAGPQAPGTVQVSGAGRSLSLSVGGSTQGTTTSTTEANVTNVCTTQLDDLPCGHGTSLQGGAVSEVLDLSGSVGTSSLVSVGSAGSQNSAYVRRLNPSGTIGRVRETVQWVVPQITIGGLPSGLQSTPAGWEGYWIRLTGFTATATAEAGQGTVAPSVTIGGGVVRYWNGSGYTNQSVTTSGTDIRMGAVDHSAGTGDGNTVQVLMDGSVTIGRSSTSEELDGADRLKGKAVVGTPLAVDMTYQLFRNGSEIANLGVEFDAGSARATTLYQPQAA